VDLQGFTNLRGIAGLRFDLKYASADNFIGRDVYGDFREPMLHAEAARMLERAAQALNRAHPGAALLIYDALRPRSVQRVLFDHVRGTEQESYVMNPDRGSMHNYGCAVDLTVLDERGRALDMGTAFDAFTPLSEPRREEEFLRERRLTVAQIENRLILRHAMTGAGFLQLPHEWWHFDAFPAAQVRAGGYRILE
jgi:D-alanyl-D-alanine dipeptidase